MLRIRGNGGGTVEKPLEFVKASSAPTRTANTDDQPSHWIADHDATHNVRLDRALDWESGRRRSPVDLRLSRHAGRLRWAVPGDARRRSPRLSRQYGHTRGLHLRLGPLRDQEKPGT